MSFCVYTFSQHSPASLVDLDIIGEEIEDELSMIYM